MHAQTLTSIKLGYFCMHRHFQQQSLQRNQLYFVALHSGKDILCNTTSEVLKLKLGWVVLQRRGRIGPVGQASWHLLG